MTKKRQKLYPGVCLSNDEDEFEEGIILRKIPNKDEYEVLNLTKMRVEIYPRDKILLDISHDIKTIYFMMSGKEVMDKNTDRDMFDAVIQVSFPYYWEVRDIIWNTFFQDLNK